MLSAIDVCLKRLMTIRAHEWLFVTVSNQMSFHATLSRKFRVTYGTAVWPGILVRM